MSSSLTCADRRARACERVGYAMLVALLLSGCVAPVVTPTPAAATPAPTAIPTLQGDPSLPEESALAWCDFDAQARVMRPSQAADWEFANWIGLELSACYNLTLDLRPDESAYIGAAHVTFTNLTGGQLSDLVFRTYPNAPILYGGALDIASVKIDGEPVTPEVFLSDRTAVRLRLNQPLEHGAMTVVDLTFEGRLPRDFGSSDVYGIFNNSTAEPLIALANWAPILAVWRDGAWQAAPVVGEGDAVVSQVALYRVSVAAPPDWQVVTTGSLISEKSEGGSIRREFASGPVRDFMVVASPALEVREAQLDDVRVAHWGLPGGESNWDTALDVARDSIAVFEERFGPYPYTELDVVAAPLQNAGGVEYPGLILIAADAYRDEEAIFLQVATAHEVAHQWWYGVVGSDVLADPWQDEALTTYSSGLYFEEHNRTLYRALMTSYELSVRGFQEEQGDEPIAQPLDAFRGRSETYGMIVYLKGALFFAAVRDAIGDDAFFRALQAYYAQGRFQIIAPETLLAAFEESCACDLDALYEEWGVIASSRRLLKSIRYG